MKKETMKCPYCGEEILSVALKCKHCGEWLNEEEDDDEMEAEEEEETFSNDNNWIYELIGVVIILVIAFFTLPSKEKQTEKMKENLRVLVRKEIKSQIRNEDVFTQAIGKKIMKDKDVVDELVRNRFSIKINDYKVFSLISVKDKETEESTTCGFAAFGIIYIK